MDGKVKVNVFGSFNIPLEKESVIRVEEIDLANYIKVLKLTEEIPQIEIEIPNMPEVSYGYLVTYDNCLKGNIFLKYLMKKEQSLPIDPQVGIAFPMEGEMIPTTFKVKYQKSGEKILRNIEFTFKTEDDVVDLCELI